ncbi:MAG TPA: YceI family protein [Thiothrix sp.]|nr:YceI family protein [Thiothrix sp.]
MKKLLLALSLGMASTFAQADWTLNADQSSLNFVSVKKNDIAEVSEFKSLAGLLKEDGSVALNVSLASVSTNIPIRDERMQKLLFEVQKHALANITAKIDMAKVTAMKAGDLSQESVEVKLALHGKEKAYNAAITVAKLSDEKVLVTLSKPIVVQASDFDLSAGVEALREVAKLPMISQAVPITASLVFVAAK